MRGILKMTRRSIRTSFGRYIALLLIVFLSAGFFAGLKITTDAMLHTGDVFLEDRNFYDYRLISTLGFSESDVDRLAELDEIEDIEACYSTDVLVDYKDGSKPIKLLQITDKINLPSLVKGKMPTSPYEVLADNDHFKEKDIGKTIPLVGEGDGIQVTEFKIVGLADSPLFLNSSDRGTTNIGSGSLFGFFYIPKEAFDLDAYTEVNITLPNSYRIYTDEYDSFVGSRKDEISALVISLANERYDTLLGGLSAYGITKEQFLSMTKEQLEALGFGDYAFLLEEPKTYTLTRNENSGYLAFENDTAIIDGVANIFPIFFIAIALLVCVTTMTRMVDEERTQIGVLKAIGFGNGRIIAKYLLYAGSATFLGWLTGYFLCTWAIPAIFWGAYGVLYGFAPLEYLFSPTLAILTLVVSLLFILGATLICCRHALKESPASLIRPRAGKGGKRILLERITPLWRRLRFIDKITLRNMFLYKQRLFMMLVGIGCCAGLVVTAFGVRDSMINIGELQYGHIQSYDMEISCKSDEIDEVAAVLEDSEEASDYLKAHYDRVDVSTDSVFGNVTLMSFDDFEELSDFWSFDNNEGRAIAYPKLGDAVINNKIAEKLDLSVGDSFTVKTNDLKTATLRVSGIFKNYVYSYICVSDETYAEAFGNWEANTLLMKIARGADAEALAAELTAMDSVTTVSRIDVARETIDSALSALNYIIWLVIGFSAALAFIVIFNLTNINIAERSREIATVQVLGFNKRETGAYALRENILLSVIATVLGLPLGILFHRTVMSMVIIDSFSFNCVINWYSYIISAVFTIAFVAVVNLFMRRHISKIKMAESLKAVE